MEITDSYLRLIWEGCLRNERKFQELFYKTLAPKMMGVCMQYAHDKDEAQDILQEGFVKIFNNLHSYRGEGNLGGWVRRIMVHTAISRYRKAKYMVLVDDFAENPSLNTATTRNGNTLEADELLGLIEQLPDNYRSVFNMYAIEGYSHQEVGNSLGISELLSRTTLYRAREILKNKLMKIQNREMYCMAG